MVKETNEVDDEVKIAHKNYEESWQIEMAGIEA